MNELINKRLSLCWHHYSIFMVLNLPLPPCFQNMLLTFNTWKFVITPHQNTFWYNSFLNPLLYYFLSFSALKKRNTIRVASSTSSGQQVLSHWSSHSRSRSRQSPLSPANIPHSIQPFWVNVMFLLATGFLTKSDVKTVHLNKQM